MPSEALLEKRKRRRLQKDQEEARPGPSPAQVERRAYIDKTAITMMAYFSTISKECVSVIVEYLVADRMIVNYASHQSSIFQSKGSEHPFTIPGWMPLQLSFESFCLRRNHDASRFVLKDEKGMVVPLTTIWTDCQLGAQDVSFIVCFRK